MTPVIRRALELACCCRSAWKCHYCQALEEETSVGKETFPLIEKWLPGLKIETFRMPSGFVDYIQAADLEVEMAKAEKLSGRKYLDGFGWHKPDSKMYSDDTHEALLIGAQLIKQDDAISLLRELLKRVEQNWNASNPQCADELDEVLRRSHAFLARSK